MGSCSIAKRVQTIFSVVLSIVGFVFIVVLFATDPSYTVTILNYDKSLGDIIVNYLEIVSTSVAMFLIENFQDFPRQRITAVFFVPFFSLSALFQIALCHLEKCTGISVVWNMFAGCILFYQLRHWQCARRCSGCSALSLQSHLVTLLGLVFPLAANIYYLVQDIKQSELVGGTMAHVLSVFIGLFIAWCRDHTAVIDETVTKRSEVRSPDSQSTTALLSSKDG